MSLSIDKALRENYSDYYTQDAELLEWRRLGALDKCANIVRLCAQFDHDEILEIGCGEGAILERLSELKFGSRFTGLEISASGVRSVQDKNIPGAEVQLFDGYELPFPEGRFQLAILSHVLEHVEYPRKLIYEAARVARKVFIEVPLEDNRRLSSDFVFDTVGHINFYNSKIIRRLVQSCGMQILNAHFSHSSHALYVYRKGRLAGSLTYVIKELGLRLSPDLAAKLLTYHYSLACTKASIW
jgi:SAM-dependent methyltransferase